MKKTIFVLLLCLSQVSGAATYYRNKYIPGGVCMVDFYGSTVNASMITDVYAGTFTKNEIKESNFFSKDVYEKTEFQAIRITLVNGTTYTSKSPTLAEVEKKKADFLKLLNDTCKP